MSVQAGIWNLDGAPVDPDALKGIGQSAAEYGPDGEATFLDGEVGLLYRPFHTTTESRSERQPHVSPGRRLILWDGRLDNRSELLLQLASDLSAEKTDVALVAAAFDKWGTDCFTKLIGEWALSVWDSCKREVILARDYIGVKQLFYYVGPSKIVWCGHLAPLVLSGDRLTLCDEYVAGYLAAQPEAHLTPFCEIQSVPPGGFVRLRGTRITSQRYWTFEARFKNWHKTDAEYEEHYRYLLRQAVRRRLRTNSPILAELSGGLDSSSIVCMADDIMSREPVETPRMSTISYYDSNEPGEDDSIHFTKVEEKRGKRGLSIDLKASGNSLAFEYSGFAPAPGFKGRPEVEIALAEIFKRQEYRVMLSGLGGDEMNGMALNPRVLLADLLGQFRLLAFSKQLVEWSLLVRRPVTHLFVAAFGQFLPAVLRCKVEEHSKLEPWVSRRFARKHHLALRQLRVMDGIWWFRPGVRDSTEGLTSMALQLTHASPSPIEPRYPYLDQTLVEFLSTVPLAQMSRPGHRRSLMRRALKNILPAEICSRKTKASAARCYAVALERHWDRVEEIVVTPLISRLGYVNAGRLRASLLEMRNGKVPKYTLRLLKALALEIWLCDLQTRGLVSIQHPALVPEGRESAELSVRRK